MYCQLHRKDKNKEKEAIAQMTCQDLPKPLFEIILYIQNVYYKLNQTHSYLNRDLHNYFLRNNLLSSTLRVQILQESITYFQQMVSIKRCVQF